MPGRDTIAADLHLDTMELTIRILAFRIITEGVVVLSIGGAERHRTRKIVAVVKRQPASVFREVLHRFMRTEDGVMGIRELIRDVLRIVRPIDGLDLWIGGRAQPSLIHVADNQSSSIHCVYGDRGESQLFGRPPISSV